MTSQLSRRTVLAGLATSAATAVTTHAVAEGMSDPVLRAIEEHRVATLAAEATVPAFQEAVERARRAGGDRVPETILSYFEPRVVVHTHAQVDAYYDAIQAGGDSAEKLAQGRDWIRARRAQAHADLRADAARVKQVDQETGLTAAWTVWSDAMKAEEDLFAVLVAMVPQTITGLIAFVRYGIEVEGRAGENGGEGYPPRALHSVEAALVRLAGAA